MAQKLKFEITRDAAPGVYAIRLVDARQIAALLLAEGLPKPFALKPLRVIYDEGGDEIVPVAGFDEDSAQGRIELVIMNGVYGEALARIHEMSAAPAPRDFSADQMQVFQY
ncbi:MAG: hypothetical protein WBS22_18175 [Methylocystis sp.]|jgi:hypothetical protein